MSHSSMYRLNSALFNATFASRLTTAFAFGPLTMKVCLFSLFLFLLAVTPMGSLRAQDTPKWLKDVTRLPPGGHADLRPVKLDYTLSWNNRVNAGKFEVAIMRDGSSEGKFVGDASGKSTGFARLVWPYDFKARSIVSENSLRPLTFQLSERERNEVNSYDIIFGNNEQQFRTTSKKENTEAVSQSRSFKFDYGHDVLSSAFYLRSLELKKGQKVSMVVTPFNKPYLANFVVVGREVHKMKGTKYSAIKLDADVGKINGDLSIKNYEKIKKTSLWVSDDRYRIPLELQTYISVGYISARLIEMDWLD
ncbi:MAG: DUF3108 domain-containing protein [Verrucomicrobiales bacterium]|nr:DUF3108 domain-containing protein [Verrucomicrobiales bacterium]